MGLFNAVMALSGMIDTDVIEDERLARHTSYRIGGKADLFVTCHSYHALRRAVAVLDREQVPWVIIGKGSNLLVADGGYRGAVISLGREFQRTVVADDGCTLTVGAGVMFARLVNDALSRSLSGLEFAVGIPGSVGGAISMNAGTRTEWIGSLVEDVVTFDPATGIKHYAGSEITWKRKGNRGRFIPVPELEEPYGRLPGLDIMLHSQINAHKESLPFLMSKKWEAVQGQRASHFKWCPQRDSNPRYPP